MTVWITAMVGEWSLKSVLLLDPLMPKARAVILKIISAFVAGVAVPCTIFPIFPPGLNPSVPYGIGSINTRLLYWHRSMPKLDWEV